MTVKTMHNVLFSFLALMSCTVIAQDSYSLNDLGWLQGCWDGTSPNQQTEECWSSPGGGLMLGYGRAVSASGKAGFEYLRVVEQGDTIVLVAQPNGDPPTEFPATTVHEQRARFANPEHDFPRVIEYERSGNELTATIGNGLTIEDSTDTVTFRFKRRQP